MKLSFKNITHPIASCKERNAGDKYNNAMKSAQHFQCSGRHIEACVEYEYAANLAEERAGFFDSKACKASEEAANELWHAVHLIESVRQLSKVDAFAEVVRRSDTIVMARLSRSIKDSDDVDNLSRNLDSVRYYDRDPAAKIVKAIRTSNTIEDLFRNLDRNQASEND